MNPLDQNWGEWVLVICLKCKKIEEWQSHSEEQMHGGDLSITANPTKDYLHYKYDLDQNEIDDILNGRKKIRRYNRYKKSYEEQDA